MCLILFAHRVRADAPLIVAANRDEFHARPAASAQHWADAPEIFAGRDLEAGGTWLGVNTLGRFAAVTNFAEPAAGEKGVGSLFPPNVDAGATASGGKRLPTPFSRGDLPAAFLSEPQSGHLSALEFAQALDVDRYAGFSLLLFDGNELVYVSNRAEGPSVVGPGVYGLANTHLEGDWPKVRRGTASLERLVHGTVSSGALLEILTDEQQPPDDELPQRGRELEFERRVAPCFIRGDAYGTRASTAVIIKPGAIEFEEQSFGPNGLAEGRVKQRISVSD